MCTACEWPEAKAGSCPCRLSRFEGSHSTKKQAGLPLRAALWQAPGWLEHRAINGIAHVKHGGQC